MYASNIQTHIYIYIAIINNYSTKGKIDSNTGIVEDFNTPLLSVDRSSRHKTEKGKKKVLNDTLDLLGLI